MHRHATSIVRRSLRRARTTTWLAGVSAAALCVLATPANAQEQHWDGDETITSFVPGTVLPLTVSTDDGIVQGGDGTWDTTSTNWTNAAGTTNSTWQGGIAVFDGITPYGTVRLPSTISLTGLRMVDTSTNGGGTPYTIFSTSGGSSLDLAAPITPFDIGAGAMLSIDSITGAGRLAKTGAGQLIVVGFGSYAGGTDVQAGLLWAQGNNALGDGPITVSGTATLRFGGPGIGSVNAGSPFAPIEVISPTASLILGEDSNLQATLYNGGSVTIAGNLGNVGIQSSGSLYFTGSPDASNAQITIGHFDYTGSPAYLANGPGDIRLDATLLTGGALALGAVNFEDSAAGFGGFGFGRGVIYLGGTTLTIGQSGNSNSSAIRFLQGGTYDPAGGIGGLGGVIGTGGSLIKVGTVDLSLGGGSYTGPTTVLEGRLLLGGQLSSAFAPGTQSVTVSPGATLKMSANTFNFVGVGSVDGHVEIAGGATLESSYIPAGLGFGNGTAGLGSLTLQPGAILNVGLGAPTSAPVFNVVTDLTLNGTLNVTDIGGFGNGAYRLFDYGGVLSGGGLSIGTTPTGFSASDLRLQSAIAGQINLVVGPGLFWDGDTIGNANNAIVDGGNGRWTAATSTWTDPTGTVNAPLPPTPSFVVFGAAAGTVTADASAGALQLSGMQFATNGYTLTGSPVALFGDGTVRVGDGTAGGAGITTTIAAPLTGTGALTKTDLGTLVLTGANSYTGGTTISGGTLIAGASILSSGTITNNATLILDQASDATLANLLAGSGSLVKQGAGTLRLTGTSSFSGLTSLTGGGLRVDGSIAGGVSAATATTLSGGGLIGGAVTVASGGHLAGATGTQLTMGSLSLSSGSNVDVALGAPSATSLFRVTGNLALNSTLNVTNAGGFGDGLYRIFDYGGTLSGSGLALGTTPAGLAATVLVVQRAVPGQVNLVVGPATFWDGDAAGTADNAIIEGGNGRWTAATRTWTDATGVANATLRPTPSFVVFGSAAGTVIADDSAGALQLSGMQFATNGYTLTGSPVALFGDGTVRVGDGTNAGAGITATIAAPLTGTGALTKTDLGTLILTGANSYSGGTTIAGGTLVTRVSSLSSGTITNNASLILDQPADVTLANVLAGSGSLAKQGAGTLRLTGTSSFSGLTAVTGGGLRVDGSIVGGVSLASGTTLSGAGAIGGPVTVASGARLSGVAGTRLTMGSLTLAQGSTVDVALGGPTATSLFGVAGNLTLAGTLNVTDAGGFGDGLYRIFDYGGTLTNTGFAIGALPQSVQRDRASLQTSVAGRVNLIIGTRLFWDGDATGSANNGRVDGGSGTWTVASSNFTGIDGAINSPFVPQPGLVAFSGNAGTVTASNAAGPLSVTGLQFAANGYALGGDPILLTGQAPAIRVGDGTSAGAFYDATIAAPLTGTGGMVKSDLGTLILTGTSSYTGTTRVAFGTLAVNGTIASPVSVESGALLRGTGRVGSTQILSGATLAPGNSIGTITVGGNLGFAAGSIYQVEVNPAASDRTNVTGVATLSGGTVSVSATPGVYARQNRYTILNATGGVTGTFAGASSTLVYLASRLEYDANNAYLVLSLDDQLSGEIHASLKSVLADDSRFVREAALDRLHEGRKDGEGAGAWLRGVGAWGHWDATGGAARVDRSLAGVLAGVDFATGPVRLGVIGGYTKTDIDVDARLSTAKSENIHAGAYIGGTWGILGARVGAAHSWHKVTTDRIIRSGGFADATRARYDADTDQAFGELSLGFRTGRATVEPYAAIAYLRLKTDGFSETGGAARLAVTASTSETGFSTLGLRGVLEASKGLTLRGGGGWRHAFQDRLSQTRIAFADGSRFDVTGLPIAEDVAAIDAAADLAIGDKIHVGVRYGGQVSSRTLDHSVKADLVIRF